MRWRVLRALYVALAVVAALAALPVLLAWWGQERVVWQPPRGPFAEPGAGAERVTYAAADGQPLFGYLVAPPADSAPNGVLLAFHGNAEVAAAGVPWAREVARGTGWAVLLAEYRGYAGLPGRPAYAGSRLDARAAYRWLHEARAAGRVPAGRVGLFGYSLGSAVAAELAAELAAEPAPAPGGAERPAVLVLQAPFTSTGDMARAVGARWLGAAWPLIGRVPFDTRRRVAAADAPVWVAHGDADRVVPAWMGRAVYAAARRPGGLLVVPGAGHGDVAAAGGARYWAFLEAALASAERPSP